MNVQPKSHSPVKKTKWTKLKFHITKNSNKSADKSQSIGGQEAKSNKSSLHKLM